MAVRTLVVTAALALVGCSAGPEMVTTCDGTLRGAIESTFSGCRPFDQIYRQSLDTFALTAGHEELSNAPGLDYTVSVSLESRGEPQGGRTIQPECLVTVTSGAKAWKAQRGLGGVPFGTCSVSYSEVVGWPQMGNTITYCILRGRLQAQLEQDPPTTASTSIDLRLDFDLAPKADDPMKQQELCGVKPM